MNYPVFVTLLSKHSCVWACYLKYIVSFGVPRHGKCRLFFFRAHLLPHMIDCLWRSEYCLLALRAHIIRNYLIPFDVPPVYNGV